MVVRIQIAFKTIQTLATEEFEQGKLKVKRIYPDKNVVKGESVPNFKINTSEGASSNVFQILQDL